MAVLIIAGYSLKTHLSRFGPEIWKKGRSIDRSNILYSLKIVLKSNQFLTKRRTSASSARHERLWICPCLMPNLSFLWKMSAAFLNLTVLKMDSPKGENYQMWRELFTEDCFIWIHIDILKFIETLICFLFIVTLLLEKFILDQFFWEHMTMKEIPFTIM